MSEFHENLSMVSHITIDEDARPSLPAAGRFPELIKTTEYAGTPLALPPLAMPRPGVWQTLLPWPILIGGGLVLVLALGVLSIYSLPDQRIHSPTVSRGLTPSEGATTTPAAASEPVRFANPFDRDEVFEFPAGTSRDEARDKVADLLKTRAAERTAAGLVPKGPHPTGRKVPVDRRRIRTP